MYCYIPYYLEETCPKNDWAALDARNKWKKTILIREKLKNIKKEEYEFWRKEFFKINEGFMRKVYLDSRKIPTIGYGFALGLPGGNFRNYVKEILLQALGYSLEDVLNGKEISETDASLLLNFSLQIRYQKIKKKLPFFDHLQLNEKLCVESVFYNSEKSIGKNFICHMKKYHYEKQKESLILAIEQIEKFSNPKISSDWQGMQNRRDREGAMLGCNEIDILIRKKIHKEYLVKKNA